VFWVISVYFNIRNTLPKSGTFLLGHPVYLGKKKIYIFKIRCIILCLWFRASLIYVNNYPTRYNTKQSISYSASSRYLFRVSITPIIRSTQNCNYRLRYWSYFLCNYLPPTWLTVQSAILFIKITCKVHVRRATTTSTRWPHWTEVAAQKI